MTNLVSDGSDTSVRSCTTLNDFIRAIKSMRLKERRPFYIALDKAERLIRISPSLPQALSRFNEIVVPLAIENNYLEDCV